MFKYQSKTDAIHCIIFLSAIISLLTSVSGLRVSKNSISNGNINVYPYTNLFIKDNMRQLPIETFPAAYLDGFHPFSKYNMAAKYLATPDSDKNLTNFIDSDVFQKTVVSVFYNIEYFLKLRSFWHQRKELYIYDMQADNFITMIKMANIPYYAKTSGLLLSTYDISTILALFEIFSLDSYERIPYNEKKNSQIDMLKRDCFKENLRHLIQSSKDAFTKYTQVLRQIRYNGRHTLFTEVPQTEISDAEWIEWLLMREKNKDIFWYLFSTLCNTTADIHLTNSILAYVKEDFILGKKGITVMFSSIGNPSPYTIGLNQYLIYKNPLTVTRLGIEIQQGLVLPEMQFSSVFDLFPRAETVIFKNLGNDCDVRQNLALVNIVLDYEQKRSERQMDSVLKGLFVDDYGSINDFAKEQMLNLNLTKIGYFNEISRTRCCFNRKNPCLAPIGNRPANFFGKLAIPFEKADTITSIAAPYHIFFVSSTISKLPHLKEINVSVVNSDMPQEYKNSELSLFIRENMHIDTARLYGEHNKDEPAHLDMFKKILKITTLHTIDISNMKINTTSLINALNSSHNLVHNSITTFAFNYYEDPGRVSYANSLRNGYISLLYNLMKTFPSLTTLDIHVENSSEAVYNIIRDFKYLLGCYPEYNKSKILSVIQLRTLIPLTLSMFTNCTFLAEKAVSDLYKVVYEIFYSINTCPNGYDSKPLREMTVDEYLVDLKYIIKKNMCPVFK
ncbi:hypothetical protein NEOKW01_0059 [Nematocida sp. AWRm80]|nr:hypothetical protein NEOKW01_0059 [Nematocida sp. AWRm80]